MLPRYLILSVCKTTGTSYDTFLIVKSWEIVLPDCSPSTYTLHVHVRHWFILGTAVHTLQQTAAHSKPKCGTTSMLVSSGSFLIQDS